MLCVRTVLGEERVLHPIECKHLLKPKPIVPCNRDVPCGQDWAVGIWEEVSLFQICSVSDSAFLLLCSFYLSNSGLFDLFLNYCICVLPFRSARSHAEEEFAHVQSHVH